MPALSQVASSLLAPERYDGPKALQEDAVRTALKAFGLATDEPAAAATVADDRDTALARIPVREDGVIEHDARFVEGFTLVDSDVTGRARFEKGRERLEVITANRRELEEVFGVDLIYLNSIKGSMVMLQYKMLERECSDWVYRPDDKLDEEIQRMRVFAKELGVGEFEYRLNSTVFYLKFVKRDGATSESAVITPLEHFDKLRRDPVTGRGPRGGVRISYEALDGGYLRQGAFVDLVRAGYIGGSKATTAHLKALIDGVLSGNKAVVAALQTSAGSGDS